MFGHVLADIRRRILVLDALVFVAPRMPFQGGVRAIRDPSECEEHQDDGRLDAAPTSPTG